MSVGRRGREVKPQRSGGRRRYDARARREAAAQTRAQILDAARATFARKGYVATTMADIARRAGVALDTVYASVGRKPVLFRLLIESAISGEDRALPPDQRSYVAAIRAEPAAARKLEIYAQAVCQILSRMAPLFAVVRHATAAEPGLARLWQKISARRAANMRLFIANVAAAGGLRADLTLDEAADVVWSTTSVEFYLSLVKERRWSPVRFERWLVDAWRRLLLAPPPAAALAGPELSRRDPR